VEDICGDEAWAYRRGKSKREATVSESLTEDYEGETTKECAMRYEIRKDTAT
jgi:hypothetical protein